MTTVSKYRVIPKELFGKNATLSAEKGYNDDYLNELNRFYSLDEILGKRKEGMLRKEWNAFTSLTMNSPAHNSEAEDILNMVLYNSAKKGAWTAYLYNHSEPDRCIKNEWAKPINMAERAGLILVRPFEKNVVSVPSQYFIDYCISKNAGMK